MRTIKIFTDPKAFELAADGTRRRIIHLLRAREHSVSQIAEELGMTPQAIYHHVRKMLDTGLIEVAKEVRVDHFIETYYQAAAEIFHFTYGEATDLAVSEAQTRDALATLVKIGFLNPLDEETTSRYVANWLKMTTIQKCCQPMLAERISQLEDLDFFVKQLAVELGGGVFMEDDQFGELQALQRDARSLLRPRLKATQP